MGRPSHGDRALVGGVMGPHTLWVPEAARNDHIPRTIYRVTDDLNGAWFVVPPGEDCASAICGQPFPDRKSASEHVEYLLAVKALEQQ